jgi:hypothetical protein
VIDEVKGQVYYARLDWPEARAEVEGEIVMKKVSILLGILIIAGFVGLRLKHSASEGQR